MHPVGLSVPPRPRRGVHCAKDMYSSLNGFMPIPLPPLRCSLSHSSRLCASSNHLLKNGYTRKSAKLMLLGMYYLHILKVLSSARRRKPRLHTPPSSMGWEMVGRNGTKRWVGALKFSWLCSLCLPCTRREGPQSPAVGNENL